ncbi:hypothetical protein FZ983_17150 [Azospirillum sp. B21]|uniref:hypothetical protein n=1 Tax=Azospirillum sp. B21 TaxID=2607496 RepID=UPI0011EF5F99|nr:hypothetical protein [Azospirillum sp. B21]KAA0579050.1 hypothetical protein FZ983_17150 [Azospirillum sp. B21]
MATALNTRVTGRDELTVLPYQITTTEGSRRVRGWVWQSCGIRRERSPRRIVIDHLPSGSLIGVAPDVKSALRAVADLDPLLDSAAAAGGHELTPAIRAVLLRHRIAIPEPVLEPALDEEAA